MTCPALEIHGRTDQGCVREINEDSMAIDQELGLLVVADGMGGHNAGEVASGLAVTTVQDFARRMIGGEKIIVPDGGDASLSPRGRQLELFVKSANAVIYQKGREVAKDYGMGTTLVAVLVDAASMTVAHVGDSRLYLYRQGALTQITEDHSLVGDQVRRGLITPDQAAHSNLQNILTRALGTEEDVKVDVADHPLLPGDIVLLASDGLTKMVADEEVAQVIAEDTAPSALVERLVDMSRDRGGVDNITIVAARVPEPKLGKALRGLAKKLFGEKKKKG